MEKYIEMLKHKNPENMTQFQRIYLGIYKSTMTFRKEFSEILSKDIKSTRFEKSKFVKSKTKVLIGFNELLKIPFLEVWRIDNPDNPLIKIFSNGKYEMIEQNISVLNIRIINILMERLHFPKVDKKLLKKSMKFIDNPQKIYNN